MDGPSYKEGAGADEGIASDKLLAAFLQLEGHGCERAAGVHSQWLFSLPEARVHMSHPCRSQAWPRDGRQESLGSS